MSEDGNPWPMTVCRACIDDAIASGRITAGRVTSDTLHIIHARKRNAARRLSGVDRPALNEPGHHHEEDTMTTATPTARKPRQSRASRAAAAIAAKPADPTVTPTDPKPDAEVVGSGTGTSTTGDNGHGYKRAAAQAAAKPADPKPQPASDQAAKPVKLTTAKAAKATGPTRTSQNREIAKAMVTALGDLVEHWDAETTGIPVEMVAASLASWANYAPVPVDFWDERLADRSGAGGRGAKNRSAAAVAS